MLGDPTDGFAETLLTSDDRLLFIALRKREIDLARAMAREPDDVDLWNEWHTAAMEVDMLYISADVQEQEILDDLNKMLRVVYSGAIGIEQLSALSGQSHRLPHSLLM